MAGLSEGSVGLGGFRAKSLGFVGLQGVLTLIR